MANLFPSGRADDQPAEPVPVRDRPVELEGALLWPWEGKHVLVTHGNASVLVNGRPILAGIRVLAHRDQIHAGASAWWFSAEDPARVEPFPGGAAAICPRCRQPVQPGSPAVCCKCGNWFHRSEELGCFDYAAVCPVCQRATTLSPPASGPEED